MMYLLDRLLAWVAPHECLGCGAEGSLLCSACRQTLVTVPERCYRCHRLSPGFRTCRSCRRSSHLVSVAVATIYDGLAKELIWRLKFNGAIAAVQDMAAIVSLVNVSPAAVLVAVPSSSDRYRQRGYNQAELLMRAWQQHFPSRRLRPLIRVGHQHQLGAGRRQRLRQLQTAFRVRQSVNVQGTHIILIDDVLTTGATLEAAATALCQAGAARVDALVFAQAY